MSTDDSKGKLPYTKPEIRELSRNDTRLKLLEHGQDRLRGRLSVIESRLDELERTLVDCQANQAELLAMTRRLVGLRKEGKE